MKCTHSAQDLSLLSLKKAKKVKISFNQKRHHAEFCLFEEKLAQKRHQAEFSPFEKKKISAKATSYGILFLSIWRKTSAKATLCGILSISWKTMNKAFNYFLDRKMLMTAAKKPGGVGGYLMPSSYVVQPGTTSYVEMAAPSPPTLFTGNFFSFLRQWHQNHHSYLPKLIQTKPKLGHKLTLEQRIG